MIVENFTKLTNYQSFPTVLYIKYRVIKGIRRSDGMQPQNKIIIIICQKHAPQKDIVCFNIGLTTEVAMSLEGFWMLSMVFIEAAETVEIWYG